jgi:hypothetical protein
MRIKVDKSNLDRAIRLWRRETGQSMAAAINEANVAWHEATLPNVKKASKGAIGNLKRSDVGQGLAVSRLIKQGKRPTKQAVKDYLDAMIRAKKKAVGFTRSLVNAGKIKARGMSPERPAGVKAQGQKASKSANRMNAWVRITYNYKGGERGDVERMILRAYDQSRGRILDIVQRNIQRRLARARRKMRL